MSRLQRIIAQMQYLVTYESAVIEDDIRDQIVEILTHEDIEHRVTMMDDENWIVDIGQYLLN
ncbi:hypothetical protein CN926_00790 [Bacillus thuringiensis]|uniref:hypothetical protein n=1 Tax=Bacillus thuringiensis TaxID=1428 RepID=UPI000BFC1304|nr:hypothetical protein [Bacillus thuringiensis]PGL88572.1 hypothetical protein CN926_00790 [Bacillus thuringiensis]PGM47387.1 hypothetical protein CN937_03705 [Bacillus thuringiensis]